MQFVQVNLKENEKPTLKDECFIHEFKFTGRINHSDFRKRLDSLQKLSAFNEENLLTKFILNEHSSVSHVPLGNDRPIILHIVQLGGKQPMIAEAQFFLKQLGLEGVQATTRSYSTQMELPTIEPNEYGLTHFLNELFCLEQANEYSHHYRPFNFKLILKQYREIFQALSLQMDLFSTANLKEEGWHEYLKLTDPIKNQTHCFKASFWTEYADGAYHYSMSQRIDAEVFDQEREDYRIQLNEQLTRLAGVQSFDELVAF